MAACASYYRMKPGIRGRFAAAVGLLVTGCMIGGKVLPVVPGHFTVYEWIALAIWAAIGLILRLSAGTSKPAAVAEPAIAGNAKG